MRQRSRWVLSLAFGLPLITWSGGCARLAHPSSGSSGAQAQEDGLQELDFSRITVQASELDSSDPGLVSDQIATRQLVVRTETFTNPNEAPVLVWIFGQGSAMAHGVCTRDRAQYEAGLSNPVPELDMQGSSAAKLNFQSLESGWDTFELPAEGSVTIRWLMSGSWAWIPGPWVAPGISCNETVPERGWAGLDLNGSFTEVIRITPMGIEESEATADERNLKPERVWIVPTVQDSLNLHWGS